MAQNTDAIDKSELEDKLGPVATAAPITIATTIQHRDDYTGGAPVHVDPDDC